ncbi:hypothetical protein BT96DRAFT_1093174, partial [Gymnopus androsaceus JB14]
SEPAAKKARKSKQKSEAGTSKSSTEKSDRVARIEHLNYKQMSVGMKIFGQIVSIQPLALVVSLPNQLFSHVPITKISSQFTSLLESMDVDEDNEDKENSEDERAESRSKVPELSDMFHPNTFALQ